MAGPDRRLSWADMQARHKWMVGAGVLATLAGAAWLALALWLPMTHRWPPGQRPSCSAAWVFR